MSIKEHEPEVLAQMELDLEHMDDPISLAQLGPLFDRLSTGFRILGGCALLLRGDSDGLFAELSRSGLTRAHHLQLRTSNEPGLRNPYLATGNSAGFFDALAARNFGLARRIATLSPDEHWPGEEYEEDYCFARFFHMAVLGEGNLQTESAGELLEHFADASEDGENARLRVCQALASQNHAEFDAAFHQLLANREVELKEAERGFWPDGRIEFRIESRIYVEGLATLAFAEKAGFVTAGEYPLCPRLARLAPGLPFPTRFSN